MKTMKNHLISFLFLVGTTSSVHAQSQPSFKDIFLHMPENICPSLTEYNRLELVDNQRNNKDMRTRNAYKSFSTMEILTDTFAHLTVSKSSEKTFCMLPCGSDSTIVMVISTVHSDSITDSSINFYTTSWNPLPAENYFQHSVSHEFRLITMDNGSNQINITHLHPLTLTLDGSSYPAPVPTPTTEKFTWDPQTKRFK